MTKEAKKGCCEKTRDGCAGFGRFLYRKGEDKDGNYTGLVMGRSGKSWAKIGFFYICFYGFLAGFFAAMLVVFLSTLNHPSAQGVGENAGPKLIQFLADNELKVAPGLNWVNNDMTSRDKFVKKTKEYLADLNKIVDDKNREACDDVEEYQGNVQCKFTMNFTSDCTAEDSYGYNTSKPCLFVKMNKVWKWSPMKDDDNPTSVLKLVCEGGKVLNGGFQMGAFPFKGQDDYMTPPVAVQVELEVKDGKTVAKTVRCRLEGKGVVPSESYVGYRAYGKVEMKVPEIDMQ